MTQSINLLSGKSVPFFTIYIPIVGYKVQTSAVALLSKHCAFEKHHIERLSYFQRVVEEGFITKIQIEKAGQIRSLITVALGVSCCFLGCFPLLSITAALWSFTFSILAHRTTRFDMKVVNAIQNMNSEKNKDFLISHLSFGRQLVYG